MENRCDSILYQSFLWNMSERIREQETMQRVLFASLKAKLIVNVSKLVKKGSIAGMHLEITNERIMILFFFVLPPFQCIWYTVLIVIPMEFLYRFRLDKKETSPESQIINQPIHYFILLLTWRLLLLLAIFFKKMQRKRDKRSSSSICWHFLQTKFGLLLLKPFICKNVLIGKRITSWAHRMKRTRANN